MMIHLILYKNAILIDIYKKKIYSIKILLINIKLHDNTKNNIAEQKIKIHINGFRLTSIH
jgi:hypothetical protein